ncbi:MAG TPA: ABC-ATPase domain-containing protein, partial [Myxococcota bacterium]|nr:ABC-ATPase domain-containing protein [Myxococcota bacterium]
MRGSASDLAACLERLDGRGYKAYRDIEGGWRFAELELFVDRVQADPFAAPSKLRVRVPLDVARLPDHALAIALQSFAQYAFPVGRDIAHPALFVHVVPGLKPFPLALGINVGELHDRAIGGNHIAFFFDDLLLFQKQFQPQGRAFGQGKRGVLNLSGNFP